MALWIGAGRLWVGWSTDKGFPLPFLWAGCLGACPWVGVCDWSPHTTVQEHMASWVHWRCRQTVSLLPPPLWMFEPDGDLSILGPSCNSQSLKHLLYALGDRPYHSGSQNGWWTQSSSWMSTTGGGNSPLVSGATQNVPPHHRVRAERDRTHVLPRLLGQCTWTWTRRRLICHGTSGLLNVQKGNERCIP